MQDTSKTVANKKPATKNSNVKTKTSASKRIQKQELQEDKTEVVINNSNEKNDVVTSKNSVDNLQNNTVPVEITLEEKAKLKKQNAINNVKSITIQVVTIMLGTFIMALGFQIFLTPHNIVPGGFMGLAKIIHDVIAKTGFTYLSTYAWYIVLNVFLYIYAVKCLGWKFGIRAGVGILSYAVFGMIIESTNFLDPVVTMIETETATSHILYAIYGGVLMGAGLGLVFRGNGSTGGCDMVALVVNKFFPTISTGQIIIFVDGAVVILSVIAYGSLVLPLYALITIFISGKVSDMFVDGIRSLRAYYIVTDKKEELSQEIFNKLNRGVTNLKCEGMFTHNDRDMLLIIVRRSQIIRLKKIVKRIDPSSFMFSHNVKEAYGNGFIAYSETIKKNKKSKTDVNLQDNNTTNTKIDNATNVENNE